MNTTVPTVAARVLDLLRERPGVIEPATLDAALSDYAWARTEDQTGMSRIEASAVANWSPIEERKEKARTVKSIALAHRNRLDRMTREAIEAELAQHVGDGERAA